MFVVVDDENEDLLSNVSDAEGLIKVFQFFEEKEKRAPKVVFIGVGNILKGDDGVGIHFIRRLRSLLSSDGEDFENVFFIEAYTVPESFTGTIREIEPDFLFLVDAAELEEVPGSVCLVQPENVINVGFSTHNLSLAMFARYLKTSIPKLEILFFGIQPQMIVLSEELSPLVSKAVECLVEVFKTALTRK